MHHNTLILAAISLILLGTAIYLVVGLLNRIHRSNRRSAAYDQEAEKNEKKPLGKIDCWETKLLQGEQALRRSQEELRNLSAHLEFVREEERTRLAREIHDELGQAMTALKMDISWLSRRLDPQRAALHEKTHSMEALIDATIQSLQRLSGELRPGLLDDLGLAAAIEWQAEEFQKRAGIACNVLLDLGEMPLSRDHNTAIFRIYQETLTNVIRHAQATRVSVLLQAQGNQMILEVKDNGRGITEQEARGAKAFGLIGMRERVLVLRGQFVIVGRPGQGTTVTVTVPLIDRESGQ